MWMVAQRRQVKPERLYTAPLSWVQFSLCVWSKLFIGGFNKVDAWPRKHFGQSGFSKPTEVYCLRNRIKNTVCWCARLHRLAREKPQPVFQNWTQITQHHNNSALHVSTEIYADSISTLAWWLHGTLNRTRHLYSSWKPFCGLQKLLNEQRTCCPTQLWMRDKGIWKPLQKINRCYCCKLKMSPLAESVFEEDKSALFHAPLRVCFDNNVKQEMNEVSRIRRVLHGTLTYFATMESAICIRSAPLMPIWTYLLAFKSVAGCFITF